MDPFGEHHDDKLLEVLQLLELPRNITLDTRLGGARMCASYAWRTYTDGFEGGDS